MATRWWVGTGTWNTSNTANWSATENGSTGQSVPGAGDDVKFGTGSTSCTIGATVSCLTLICNANFSGTITGSSALTVAGTAFTLAGGTFSYSGALSFTLAAGTCVITTAGKSLSCAITWNGAGTFQLADAFASTTTITHTLGTWDCNSKTMQATVYNSAGASTRALVAAGSAWTLTGTGTVVNVASSLTMTSAPDSITINNATATGKTFTGGSKTWNDVIFSGAGSGSLTFNSASTTYRDITITNSNSAGVAISATTTLRNFSSSGWAGVLSGASAVTCTGSWTWDSAIGTPTWNGTLTFGGSSGTQTITSNGKTFAGAVTINNAGATAQLADAFITSGAFTVTAGTFNSNSKSMRSTLFTAVVSNTRSITLDNTAYTCTGSGTAVNIIGTGITFSMTGGSFTVSDASASSKTVQVNIPITLGDLSFTGAGTGALTIIGNDSTPPVFRDIFVANTGGAGFSITSGNFSCRNLDFTSYTGVYSGNRGGNVSGNLTLGATMATVTCIGVVTFNGTSGTQTITSNGVSHSLQPTINNSGTAIVSLADNFTTSSGTFTVTAGSFTTNSKSLTCRKFISTNSNTRSITLDNSVITCTVPTSGNAWDFTNASGLTLSATGSEIKLNGIVTGVTPTFAGGGQTYHYLTLIGAAGVTSGGYVVSGSNTFDKIEIQGTGGTAQRVFFNDGDTQTVTRFVAQGVTAGHFTLGSFSGGAAYISKSAGEMIEIDYVELVGGLNVKGGALWFAGVHSTATADSNQGWFLFSSPLPALLVG